MKSCKLIRNISKFLERKFLKIYILMILCFLEKKILKNVEFDFWDLLVSLLVLLV